MFEPTPANILSMGMLMVGDLLAITAVLLPALVLIGVLGSALGRISFVGMVKYWVASLALVILCGIGLVTKAGDVTLQNEPNGLLLQLSNELTLTLLGAALFFLIASAGLLLYVWNK